MFMKKLWFLVLTISIVSCKKDNTQPNTSSSTSTTATTTTTTSNNNQSSLVKFNTPQWLIGNWSNETYASIGQYNIFGFSITNDDVKQIQAGVSSSFKTNLNDGKGSITNEISNSTDYSFTTTISSISGNYFFKKIDANSIMFYNQNPNLPNVSGMKLIRY
jgi:hypothetical protein